jgi:1,2-diacylglycerol 3-beta-glucosyltransferase
MTPEYALIAFLVLYVLQVALVARAARRPRDVQCDNPQHFVSVLVAARNEEKHLAACLDSVLRQTYDPTLFEVIVINDHSTDGTESICKEYSRAFANFSYANAKENSALKGKPNALDQGIEKAKGAIILITDADCSVPNTWVEHTARRYSPSVGLVGGITLQKARNWFEGMQSLDWAFLLGLASSTVTLRIPLSTIGNNLSFRKSAYEAVGGYKTIPFSVTEDFMLFQSIVSTGRWEYVCPIDEKVLVISEPCASWKELIRQKHRWGKGGLGMKPSGFAVMAIGFGLNALVLILFLFGNAPLAAASIFLKMAADFGFLSTVLSRLNRRHLLKHFLAFEVYFFSYVLFLPFIVFFGGRVIWKGRDY